MYGEMATSMTATCELTASGSTSLGIEDDLKCATCLELFQDPRSLPCLHTFCLECIKRTINGSNTFKCPLCRAVHKLSEEKAELLPVDQYAVQELPLRRLQQWEATSRRKCQTCEEQTLIAAWCVECNGVICQPCVTLHKKLVPLREHSVVEKKEDESGKSLVKGSKSLSCLQHAGENLKYLCIECSELVCAECILMAHKDHKYSTAGEARHNLKIKMEELASLAIAKKEEFNDYFKKVKIVENEAIECAEDMRCAVNKTFDAIVASIEAQRNEALQSVSQGAKKIWSQKNMMEVRMAQVDSFIRFVDHAHKCNTSTSYVAMATQAIKLIKQLKDAHGDKDTPSLDYKMVAISTQSYKDPLHLSVPLDRVIKLGQPMFEFAPDSGSLTVSQQRSVSITVTLKVQGLPIVLPTPHKGTYNLVVKARSPAFSFSINPISTSVNLLQSQWLSWEIVAQLPTEEGLGVYSRKLTIWCSMAGNMEIIPSEVTYRIKKIYHEPPPPHSENSRGDASCLTLQQLTSMDPHQQKQIIGEHLYRKIHKINPQLVGITGTICILMIFSEHLACCLPSFSKLSSLENILSVILHASR